MQDVNYDCLAPDSQLIFVIFKHCVPQTYILDGRLCWAMHWAKTFYEPQVVREGFMGKNLWCKTIVDCLLGCSCGLCVCKVSWPWWSCFHQCFAFCCVLAVAQSHDSTADICHEKIAGQRHFQFGGRYTILQQINRTQNFKDCVHDYSAKCPDRWVMKGRLCQAPSDYVGMWFVHDFPSNACVSIVRSVTGICGFLVDTTNYTKAAKHAHAEACLVRVVGEPSINRLRHWSRIDV